MKEDYINQINDSFVEFSQKTNERFPAKLKTIRNNAQNSFNSIGFPTKKMKSGNTPILHSFSIMILNFPLKMKSIIKA